MSEDLPPRLPNWQRYGAIYFFNMMGTFTGVGVLAFFGLLWDRSTQSIDDEYDNDREVAVLATEIKAVSETMMNEISKIRAEMEMKHKEPNVPPMHGAAMPFINDINSPNAENREDAYDALDSQKKEIRQKYYDNLNTQQQSLPPPRK